MLSGGESILFSRIFYDIGGITLSAWLTRGVVYSKICAKLNWQLGNLMWYESLISPPSPFVPCWRLTPSKCSHCTSTEPSGFYQQMAPMHHVGSEFDSNDLGESFPSREVCIWNHLNMAGNHFHQSLTGWRCVGAPFRWWMNIGRNMMAKKPVERSRSPKPVMPYRAPSGVRFAVGHGEGASWDAAAPGVGALILYAALGLKGHWKSHQDMFALFNQCIRLLIFLRICTWRHIPVWNTTALHLHHWKLEWNPT